MRRLPWLHLIGGLGTGLALLFATIALLSLADSTRHNCRQVELVKTRIRTVVSQSVQTLGQPGSAGYAYYRAHPAELAQARRSARRSLDTFRAGRC